MNCDFLVDVELDRVDWKNVRDALGPAVDVPANFRQLLAATNDPEVKRAYWKLENHVVVQGQVYEASIHLVPAICAALADPNRSLLVRTWIVELLYQICGPYSVPSSESSASIVDSCRNAARNALWNLYGELAKQEIKVVESLIKSLDADPDRLALVRTKIPNYNAPIWTTKRQA